MTAVPLLLTLVSAVLYALSFPPCSLFLLAWVALVPFFLAATLVRPGYAAVYGILWGVAAAYGVGWWFPGMVANYFGLSTVAGWAGFFAVSIGLAGFYFGAFAAWLSWLARRQAASPLLVAAGWGACEFARANLLIGNPWALSGYSQVTLTRLMQVADATGPYGVGMLIAAVNACLAGLVAPRLRGQRPAISFVGVVAALGSALVYGEWRLSQTLATGEPVQVAVIQGAIQHKFRWSPEHHEADLERYLALTKEAAVARPNLILWPEYAVDFYLQEDSPQSKAVLGVTRDLGADLILGGPHYGYGVTDIRYHNSIFLVRSGTLAGRYDKLRLLPFAEEDLLSWVLSQRRSSYEPGHYLHVLRTGAARIGTFVCFEAMYPDLVRGFALQGAEVLVNPSNDSWFGHAAPARHQLDIAAVRAIENRRYLVRPTATGFSAVIDPYGRVAALSGFGSPDVLTTSIRLLQVQTPYQRWGDVVCWIAVALAVATSLYHIDWLGQKLRGRRAL